MSDRPGAFTYFQGRRIVVLKGRDLDRAPSDRPPGEVAATGKAGVEVACGGGSGYLIESLQPEARKAMPAYAFSLGAKLSPGASFE